MWQLFQGRIYSVCGSVIILKTCNLRLTWYYVKVFFFFILSKKDNSKHSLYEEGMHNNSGSTFFVGLLTRIQESDDKGVCTRVLWCLAKQNLDVVIVNTKVGIIYGHIFCHSSTSKSGQNLLVLVFKLKIYGKTFARCTEPLKTYVSTLPPYPDTERLPHPTTLGV